MYRNVKDALYDAEVYEYFQITLKNAKKNHTSSSTTANSSNTATAVGSDEIIGTNNTMKSSSEELQILLDSIKDASSGVVNESIPNTTNPDEESNPVSTTISSTVDCSDSEHNIENMNNKNTTTTNIKKKDSKIIKRESKRTVSSNNSKSSNRSTRKPLSSKMNVQDDEDDEVYSDNEAVY